jgi:hypothetical protein
VPVSQVRKPAGRYKKCRPGRTLAMQGTMQGFRDELEYVAYFFSPPSRAIAGLQK